MRYYDEYPAVLIGCCLEDCLPGFPVTDRISLERVISVLSLLCLLSPWMCLLLSFLPFNSFFVLHLILSPPVSCFSHSFCPPPLSLSPPHLCPSYSLSLSHHSQYGIHKEGVCYVRSNWAVWTPSEDVEIQLSSSEAGQNLAITCDAKRRAGHAKVLDCPLLNKMIRLMWRAAIKASRAAGREWTTREPKQYIRALMDLLPSCEHVTERMQTPRALCPLRSPAPHRLDWMKVLHKRARAHACTFLMTGNLLNFQTEQISLEKLSQMYWCFCHNFFDSNPFLMNLCCITVDRSMICSIVAPLCRNPLFEYTIKAFFHQSLIIQTML